MAVKQRLALLAALMLLTGCGGPRAVMGLDSARRGEPATAVPIFMATTRARSDDLSRPYSAERSQMLNFAEFDIGIPRNHVPGEVEKTGHTPDPARHFTARTYRPIDDRKQFVAQLDAALMQRPPASREIFIFVHGYNNNIADSVFRAAQIAQDFNVQAVSLHYAWPSGGALPLYVYDRDSTVVGRGGLADTIEIAGQTKASRIILVGHSMGAYVVMEALRELAQTGRGRYLKRLGGVVLAAPDIDVDAFQSQVRDIGELPQPFAIVVSRRDRALSISRRIAGGHPRVGSGSDIALLQKKGITVLDASELDGGNHAVFASSPTLIGLFGNGLLMRRFIDSDEGSATETVLADGGSAVEGAAALVVYLPARIIGGALIAGRSR
ncbi:alpha/beta hydrolase [Mesorhizobium sp. ANAO-SY3R2]|uniref:alpha/beta hydrolase n=1 Tax=Mesorhizobium sp. ANAO-SY3R2 TaxID=3166644 RepID=UPI00366C3006